MDSGSLAPAAGSPVGEALSGRYQILSRLGQGASADVYRVRDAASGRELALKVMRQVPEAGEALAFRREFLLLTRLRHPGLVQVFDFEVLPDGRPCFSAEIVEGKSLGDVGRLSGDDATAAVRDLARVLDHLHRSSLVHCDLKPDNAVRTPAGAIKLLDLGLAQAPGEGRSGGTPTFMAPEVARGAPTDPRSDLYSLGAVGYFLLTGRPPHQGSSAAEVLAEAMRQPPPPLPATAPPDLARVVMALLAKDPAARPPLVSVLATLGVGDTGRQVLPDRVLDTPLVGRQAELAELATLLDHARSTGQLAVVRVSGPAGIGKDRLLAEFRAGRQAAGMRFAVGRSVPGGANYHAFDEAVRALGADTAPPWQAKSDMPASRSAMLGAVTAYFARLGRSGPVAIHLADWHAADPASKAVLAHLEQTRPAGSVVLFVSDRQPHDRALAIGPLPEGDTKAAAEAMLGGIPLAPALGHELHAVSEGNPLFLNGILARTLALDLLEPAVAGMRSRKPLAAYAMPSNLAEAMLERLSGRGAAAVLLARTLAILGHPAALPLLARASDLAPDAFAVALDELEAAGMLHLHEERAVLSQGAMGEAVAAALPAQDRLAIQKRLVLALEALVEPSERERDPEVTEDLARHAMPWDPGGRGLRYGLAAARGHLKVYAVDRARAFLEAGLEHFVNHPDEPATGRGPLESSYLELLADAHRHSGAFGAARERYEALLALLPGDDARRPRVWTSLGLACQSLSGYEDALKAFDRACTEAERLNEPFQGLRALTSEARLAYLNGDVERAAGAARKALKAARQHDSPALLAESLALIGYLMVVQDPAAGEHGLALLNEALSLRRKLGDPVALGDGLMFLGNAQIIAGRPLEALRTFSDNLQICRDTGAAAEDAVTALLNIAIARLDLGAFQEATAGARDALETARSVGSRDLEVYAQTIEAVAIAQTGKLATAGDLLRQAVAAARSLESPYLEAAALSLGAEAKLALGSALEARDDLVRARKLAAEAGTLEFESRALFLLADAYSQLAEYDAARQACDELESTARKLGTSSPLARWYLARGEVARRLGDLPNAEDMLGQALGLAEQLGMAHVVGKAALCRGRARAEAGKLAGAREDLLAAQRTAAQIGCPHLLVESLLALSGTTFDGAEAGRYREMAEGHLGPLLSGLSVAERARYMGAGDRLGAGRGSDRAGARIPAELQALVPFLDRPLRDLLANLQEGGGDSLPVGDLVARLLQERPDPDQVLARTLELARERFGAERCLAVLKGVDDFEVRAMIPASEDLFRFSHSFLDMAVAQDRTLWTVDALADPRLSANESVARLEMRAIACTPVRAAGRAVGALYLDWSDPSGGLSEAGKRDFETLAGIAGVCLAQAELMAGLEQRSERLEMMNELSSALARTLSVDDLLDLALRDSLRISGAQIGCVLVGPELALHLARDRAGGVLPGMRVSNAVCERLRREPEAFALIDAEAESLSASVAAEGLRSVMAVPVHVDGALRGAFYLASGVSVRGFSARDLTLLQAVANQVAVALGRVDLVNELARRERMRRELEIARDVQNGLLPKHLPAGQGFVLAAGSLPALEVGGDFYDALALPGGRIGLFIGDVAGKGVPAALLMASLLSGFRAIAPALDDPAAVMARLNDLLIAQRSSAGVFATALFAIYDPECRRLVWSCAGHNPPLGWPAGIPCEGPVLGLMPGLEFTTDSAILDAGTLLAFYTDGLEDARGPANVAQALSEIGTRFADLRTAGAQACAEGLMRLVETESTAGETAPGAGERLARYDDVTVLVLSVDSSCQGYSPAEAG